MIALWMRCAVARADRALAAVRREKEAERLEKDLEHAQVRLEGKCKQPRSDFRKSRKEVSSVFASQGRAMLTSQRLLALCGDGCSHRVCRRCWLAALRTLWTRTATTRCHPPSRPRILPLSICCKCGVDLLYWQDCSAVTRSTLRRAVRLQRCL